MDTFKALFWKPDPAEQVRCHSTRKEASPANPVQLRKCNQLIRQNARKLDGHISDLKRLEGTAKNQILAASRRAQKNPSQAKQAAQETRIFAREMVKIRKQSTRLNTSKAQLQSVGMQVNEAFSVRKIEGSIRASTGIMKDVNSLVRLPELTGTMRELSQELMKAGIIEEMVAEDLIPDLEEEDEEAEAEVDKVLTTLKSGPAVALRRTKQAINAATLTELDAAIERETEGQLSLLHSDDLREGMRAFQERRPATFTDS